MLELAKVHSILIQKLIKIYFSRRGDSFGQAHINQYPHSHKSNCDIPVDCFWTVDVSRNDEVVRYQKYCVGELVRNVNIWK